MIHLLFRCSRRSRYYKKKKATKKKKKSYYVPRKSPRLHTIKPDGNTWVELRVVSRKNPAISRSLFYSINTRNAMWDEPPTGASEVVYDLGLI